MPYIYGVTPLKSIFKAAGSLCREPRVWAWREGTGVPDTEMLLICWVTLCGCLFPTCFSPWAHREM